ncbi:twisted gastrulation protein homolog 1-A [Hemiscyllium ocellatum]|uniref:twisted gastrulation protein homolog 1-A n=1 Tax=Hemiscyllium ocellatum TaxID=170820 RepID=UPI002966D0F4|nr:twisted gastrulation protein homolog 1-A [Hemiscyllium ocellatum]
MGRDETGRGRIPVGAGGRAAARVRLGSPRRQESDLRKMKSRYTVVPTIAIVFFACWVTSASACNKALCASDVSKCLIQELCQCRPIDGNCSCCKECMLCLGTLWDECCDCVGMCNPRNYSDTPPTSKSTVEELHEPIPSLFRALTEGETHLHWNIVSFPVSEELTYHENLVSFLESFDMSPLQNVSLPEESPHVQLENEKEPHCTVVYFDDCMSIHQCKNSCESMGASKYRWFHNACCECIGPDCIDYGNKVVKCMNCTF